MAAFTFKLEQRDGTPADPPSFRTAVSTWHVGDVIPVRAGRSVRVVDVWDRGDTDADPVLVVEATT
jgi:hypothetical protein